MTGRWTTLRLVLRSPTGAGAAVLVILFGTLAVIGPPIWGAQATHIDAAQAYQGPASDAWLGTDGLGRDVLARTLAATRLSLGLALAATVIAVLIGVPAGAMVPMLGTRLRRAASSAIGFGVGLPGLLVALFVVTIVGPGALGATLAIGLALAPFFARTAETLAVSVAESEYLAAARALGIGRRRLLLRHVLPNTGEALVLQMGVGAGHALVLISALSFLGLGVQAPGYDWGRILNDGLEALYTTPLAAITPGVAITLAGLMFGFLAESVARSLNPALQVEVQRGRRKRSMDAAVATGGRGPRGNHTVRPASSAPATVAVENLRVAFPRDGQVLEAAAGVSFEIRAGEIVGMVGESGSGKSMIALALAGLVPSPGRVGADRMEFKGVDLLCISKRERRRLLATRLAVIFQDPMSSLNPAIRIGRQLTEKVEVHAGVRRRDANALAEQRLTQVHLAAARRRLRQYPHEYSGGMRQRVMIAMGLMTDPALIIADEPTTALDVTVQAQILDVLREINERSGTSVLFISHDLAVVSELCSRVLVIYAGRIVEVLDVRDLEQPAHPYTQALLRTAVDLDTDRRRPLTTIAGQVASLDRPAGGCPFAPRCPEATNICRRENPALEPLDRSEHLVACWARIAGSSPSRAVAEPSR